MASSSKALNQVLVVLTFLLGLLSCVVFTGSNVSSSLNDNTEKGDLVFSTCKKTLYFQLCMSSLRSDPRSESSDLKGLALISLNLSIAKGADTLSYLKSLNSEVSSSHGTSQLMSRYLSDCVDAYSDAIQDLEDSVQALNDMSYDTLKSLVSAAMTDSETCEDGFKEIKGFSSPLTEQNKHFSQLCSNFLAITSLLY